MEKRQREIAAPVVADSRRSTTTKVGNGDDVEVSRISKKLPRNVAFVDW